MATLWHHDCGLEKGVSWEGGSFHCIFFSHCDSYRNILPFVQVSGPPQTPCSPVLHCHHCQRCRTLHSARSCSWGTLTHDKKKNPIKTWFKKSDQSKSNDSLLNSIRLKSSLRAAFPCVRLPVRFGVFSSQWQMYCVICMDVRFGVRQNGRLAEHSALLVFFRPGSLVCGTGSLLTGDLLIKYKLSASVCPFADFY